MYIDIDIQMKYLILKIDWDKQNRKEIFQQHLLHMIVRDRMHIDIFPLFQKEINNRGENRGVGGVGEQNTKASHIYFTL